MRGWIRPLTPGEKGDGDHEGAEAAVARSPFNDQIEKKDRPGEETERLVEVRKRRMADPHIVGVFPAQQEGRTVQQKTEPGDPGGRASPEFLPADHPDEIQKK
jgi:hypothetical protein